MNFFVSRKRRSNMDYKYEYTLYFDEDDDDRSIKNIIKKVERHHLPTFRYYFTFRL